MIKLKPHLLPANLDIDKHIQDHPPLFKDFSKQKLIQIIHSYYHSLSYHKSVHIINGWVPLNAQTLKNHIIRNYKQYLNYLVNTGIFETDNHYEVGYKSKSYRISPKYTQFGEKYINLEIKTLYKQNTRKISNVPVKYNYLLRWVEKLAVVNHYDISDEVSRNKTYLPLVDIQNKEYHFSYGENGKRLFTVFTNMQKDLRKYLKINDEPLVGSDLRNSQPFLSTVLFQDSFWSLDSEFNVYQIFPEIDMDIEQYRLELTDLHFAADVVKYVQMSRTGKIYELFEQKGMTRDEAKKTMFGIIYGDNKYSNKNKTVFKELYPTVWRLFGLIKSKHKNNLVLLLQRIESFIILNQVCKRMLDEMPKAPIITLHDCIATTPKYIEYTTRIIKEEMKKYIGNEPTINIEEWV
jgi:hypothetical protein